MATSTTEIGIAANDGGFLDAYGIENRGWTDTMKKKYLDRPDK